MRKKKKGKSTGKQASPLKPADLLRKKARNYPIYECRITDTGIEGGKFDIAVARTKPNGNLIVGFFLVDTWCLGLKDTFYRHDMTIDEYKKIMSSTANGHFDTSPWKVCEPNHAFNLIYGAVEYADDLGFEPPKDFELTKFILADVDDVAFEEIEFGKNGKPFYLSGPDDNVQAVLAKLNRNVGPGNYHFTTMVDDFDDEDDLDYALPNESLESILPQHKVDAVLESMPEERRSDYMFHILMAGIINNMLEGNFNELEEEYDPDFVDELLEEYEGILSEMQRMEGADPEEIPFEPDMWGPLVKYIVGNILETGGVEFLLDKKFVPFPISNPAALNDLSEKETEKIYQTLTRGMLVSDIIEMLIEESTLMFLEDHYGGQLPASIHDDTIKEEILRKVIEHLDSISTKLFDTDEDKEEYCREAVFEIMDNIDNLKLP